MNLLTIGTELASRVASVLGQGYVTPTAGEPEVPCGIVEFPTIERFHTDYGNCVVHMTYEIRLLVGRGDAEEGYAQLAEMISTDSTIPVIEALRNRTGSEPWVRLALQRTEPPRDEGDRLSVSVFIEIDA